MYFISVADDQTHGIEGSFFFLDLKRLITLAKQRDREKFFMMPKGTKKLV